MSEPQGLQCDYADHCWAPAGGGLEICMLCKSERWHDKEPLAKPSEEVDMDSTEQHKLGRVQPSARHIGGYERICGYGRSAGTSRAARASADHHVSRGVRGEVGQCRRTPEIASRVYARLHSYGTSVPPRTSRSAHLFLPIASI